MQFAMVSPFKESLFVLSFLLVKNLEEMGVVLTISFPESVQCVIVKARLCPHMGPVDK